MELPAILWNYPITGILQGVGICDPFVATRVHKGESRRLILSRSNHEVAG